MPKVSPRDAVKMYLVSRATLMRALINGKISAEKTDAGHWQIDTAELARVYKPRPSSRTRPDQLNRSEIPPEPPMPDQLNRSDTPPKLYHSPSLPPADPDLAVRLARAETALEAEREKTAMLQRHLDDVRRLLPPPDAKPRRWWPW